MAGTVTKHQQHLKNIWECNIEHRAYRALSLIKPCVLLFSGLAKDCHELFLQGQRVSGVYAIQPENSQPFNVLCEMTSGESRQRRIKRK